MPSILAPDEAELGRVKGQKWGLDKDRHALGSFLLLSAFSLELFQKLLMCPPTGSSLNNYPAATGYKSSSPLIRL